MKSNDNYEKLNKKYPFLTVGSYSGEEFVGIIQNSSKSLVSMYIFDKIKDNELRKKFLLLGEEWWWMSNRTISINLFLRSDFEIFKPYLKHFSAKEFKVICGPLISMEHLAKKRVKRRQIQLLRDPEKIQR